MLGMEVRFIQRDLVLDTTLVKNWNKRICFGREIMNMTVFARVISIYGCEHCTFRGCILKLNIPLCSLLSGSGGTQRRYWLWRPEFKEIFLVNVGHNLQCNGYVYDAKLLSNVLMQSMLSIGDGDLFAVGMPIEMVSTASIVRTFLFWKWSRNWMLKMRSSSSSQYSKKATNCISDLVCC